MDFNEARRGSVFTDLEGNHLLVKRYDMVTSLDLFDIMCLSVMFEV